MAGKGPTGLAVKDLVRTDECEQSPDKKQFTSLADAQEQADYDNRKYPNATAHVAYTCPSCGLFHVTSKTLYGDVVLARPDGVIVTAGMATRAAKRMRSVSSTLPERVDMTEIIAHERPIIPENRAARDKLLDDFLRGKTVTTMAEITELLHITNQGGGDIMRAHGWKAIPASAGGKARWIPQDADPLDSDEIYQKVKTFLDARTTTTVKAVADKFHLSEYTARTRMVQAGWGRDGNTITWRPLGDKITVAVPEPTPSKGKKSHVPAAVRSRRRKLEKYLMTHPSPTTDELTTVLKVPRHVLRDDMATLGWWIRKGRNATWSQGERPLHLVPESEPDSPQEPDMADTAPEPEPANLIDLPTPAAAAPAPPPAVVIDDPGWRSLEVNDKLLGMSLEQICDTMEAFGMELRIQIR